MLALGSLPVALPLGLLALGLAHGLSATAQAAMLSAAPGLAWVGIQVVRPLLIAALYPLYHDLWQAELARRQREGGPRAGPGAGRARADAASSEAGAMALNAARFPNHALSANFGARDQTSRPAPRRRCGLQMPGPCLLVPRACPLRPGDRDDDRRVLVGADRTAQVLA